MAESRLLLNMVLAQEGRVKIDALVARVAALKESIAGLPDAEAALFEPVFDEFFSLLLQLGDFLVVVEADLQAEATSAGEN